MAKDPRFNFYPDNWSGGTKRMSFEQKGAYLELLLLNFYCLSDGLNGFTEEEALKVLGNATACAELWKYLMPKFKRKENIFYSERMSKEFEKSKISSEKQSDRAKKRWSDKNSAHAVALPDNGNGNGIENSNGLEKGVQGEKQNDDVFSVFEKQLLTPGQSREARCMTISKLKNGLEKEKAESLHDGFVLDFVLNLRGKNKWEGTRDATEYFMNWVNTQIKNQKSPTAVLTPFKKKNFNLEITNS